MAAAPPFALFPGDGAGIIDYTERAGIEVYRQGIRPLYADPADNFNVESEGLQTFLALLRHRGNTCGWDFMVPMDIQNPHLGVMHDLTANHGRFTLDHIHQWCQTYVNQPNRAAQDNVQMVKCILASLSLPGFRKVQTWHQQWHHNGTPCALTLVKVIIREAYIDTQATTRILRESLSSLPAKLAEFKGDIDQLNAFVKVTQDQLGARGETTLDLLANLFKGYLSSQDARFRSYIEKKQEDYDEGTPITVDSLMSLASNKFKTLVQSGRWMSPSDDQAKILALQSKLATFDKRSNRNTGQPSKNNPRPSNPKKGKSNNRPPQKKKGNSPKDFPKWMTEFPGVKFIESNVPKVVDGKNYWWCKFHKRFVMHQQTECKLNPSNSGNPRTSGGSNRPAASGASISPSIRVSTATMMDE